MTHKICSPTKLILGILVASTFSLPINTFATEGIFETAGIIDRIKKEVAKISIGKQVDIVEASIYDGLSTALSYRIESEPSYIDGYYTRIDRYRLRVDLNPGDLIEDDTTPFGFNIRKDVEVLFARQFKSQKESLTSLPYTFKNFPLTADRALQRMKVGDFVAFQTNLSLVLSVSNFPDLGSTIALGASTHAMISGEFMIHFYKMPGNHIRMKIIAIRSKGYGGDSSVDLAHGVKIVGFKVLDKRIRDIVDLEPVKVSASKKKHDLFLIDYVFNLSDPSAAQSFTDIVKNKLRFKDIGISNPLADDRKLRDAVITNIESAERLVATDKLLKPNERRVQRIFKGSNSLSTTGGRVKVGINLAKYEKGFGYGQNKVIETDLNETHHYYLMDAFSIYTKVKLLFGLYGEENIDNTSLLFSANEDFAPDKFVSFILSHEAKMRNMTEKDFEGIQNHAKDILPGRLYSRIDWKNWEFSKGAKTAGYFKEEIFLEPQAMYAIPARDQHTIEKTYTQYLLDIGKPKSKPRHGIPLDPRRFVGSKWIEVYRADLQVIAQNFAIIINPQSNSQQRYTAYNTLKGIPVYRETVAGYIISLLPPNDLERLLTYKLTLSAKGVNTIYQEFGKFEDYELYESLVYIQNVISSRSYDLRLLAGTDGELSVP